MLEVDSRPREVAGPSAAAIYFAASRKLQYPLVFPLNRNFNLLHTRWVEEALHGWSQGGGLLPISKADAFEPFRWPQRWGSMHANTLLYLKEEHCES